MINEIFEAIRNSETLGRGSCSSLDECYSDSELKEDIQECLNEGTFKNVKSALKFYAKIEGIRLEREAEYEGW